MTDLIEKGAVESHFGAAMTALDSAAPDVITTQPESFWREHFLPMVKSPAIWGSAIVLVGAAVLFNGVDLPAIKASVAQWEAEVANKFPEVNFFVFKTLKFLASLVAADQLDPDDPSIVQFTKMASVGMGMGAGAIMLTKTGATLAQATHFVENLPWVRERAIAEGRQALKPKEIPDRVIIGPTGLVSDFANLRETEDNLVVAIHSGGTPAALGETLDYHFPLENFGGELKSPKLLKESGADRAKRLTFLCVNPYNGIFYGDDSQPLISANSISSTLRSLPPEQIKGMAVDVLLSKGFDFLGRTTALVEEFAALEQDLGVKIRWRYLEDVVLDDFKGAVEKIAATKKAGESVNIVLAGEGKSEKDKKMLKRFSQALPGLGKNIRVALVDNESIDGKTSGTDEKRRRKLETLLQASDLNIVYGDTNDGSTEVAELLIKIRGAERNQTVVVLESLTAVEEARRAKLLTLSLYQKALDSMS